MGEFLQHLTALSLGGGLVILVLMAAARLTGSRYAARWRCWVWLLLCLRLAVPLPLLPQASERAAPIQLPTVEDRVVLQPTPSPAASASEPGPETQPSPNPAPEISAPGALPKEPFSLSAWQLLFALWLAGMAGVLAWGVVSHLRFLRYLRRWAAPVGEPEVLSLYNALGDKLGLDRRPRLLSCPGLSVPMLAGMFRPVLLLPEERPAGDALKYSLLHELTHYHRWDIWRKALALWVRAVHWFNPLVWLAVRWMDRDLELSCDEGALKLLPPEEHAAYGRTILAAVSALSKPSRRL